MNWTSRITEGIENWLTLSLLEEQENLKPYIQELTNIKEDLQDELTVMIAGEFNAGKSTFINALLGERVVAVDVIPATAVITKLTYNTHEKVIAHFKDKTIKEFDRQWLSQLTTEEHGKFEFIRKKLNYVEIQFPNDLLKYFTIVDSPGLNANHFHHTEITEDFLGRADVVLWLFHYREVGTATSYQWLGKLNALNIEPIAIINAIDSHNDEQDIEDYYEDNRQRLSNQIKITDLIGVSAKEALEGKLNNDKELLDWSDWFKIDELFQELREKRVKIKAERALSKLVQPLKEMDIEFMRLWSELKISDSLELIKNFQTELPSLVIEKEKTIKELETIYKQNRELEKILPPEIKEPKRSLEVAQNILLKVEPLESVAFFNQSETVSLIQNTIPGVIRSIDQKTVEYKEEYLNLKEKREELDYEWQILQNIRFFKHLRHKKYERKQIDLNIDIQYLHNRETGLKKLHTKLLDSFNKLDESFGEFITEETNNLIFKEKEIVNRYKTHYQYLTKKYGELDEKQLEEITKFHRTIHFFVKEVLSNLITKQEDIVELDSYKECLYIAQNIYAMFTKFDGIENVSYLTSLNEKQIHGDRIVNKEINPFLPSKAFHIVSLKSLNPLKHPVVTHTKFSKNEKIFVLSASALIGLSIFLTVQGGVSTENADADYEENAVSTVNDEYEEEEIESLDDANSAVTPIEQQDLKEFLNTVHSDLYDLKVLPSEGVFSEQAWANFELFYDGTAAAENYSFSIFNIKYVDDYTALVTATENFQLEQTDRIYKVIYTINLIGLDELMIEDVSFSVTEEEAISIDVEDGLIEDTLQLFRNDYMTALNNENFDLISSYFSPTGTAREELYNYINSISGKGYTFMFEQFNVTGIEKTGPKTYVASTNEVFVFSDAQSNKTKYVKTKEYTLSAISPNEIAIEQIKDLSKETESIIESTTELVTEEDVNEFIQNHYYRLEVAFNGSGFNVLAPYYDRNGTEYDQTEGYISNAIEKQMKMKNLYQEVQTIEKADSNHYLVNFYVEDEYRYRDGSGDRKKVSVEYLLKVTNEGKLLIESIQDLTVLEEIDITEGE
ncbi:dynamin family protein [Fictibacillus halophilus]|uniref:TcaA NTF2-like domain-containing protein n=1 Tax=Fictibacillus halophilus TaxID=1610490 RepID=UPI00364584FC